MLAIRLFRSVDDARLRLCRCRADALPQESRSIAVHLHTLTFARPHLMDSLPDEWRKYKHYEDYLDMCLIIYLVLFKHLYYLGMLRYVFSWRAPALRSRHNVYT